MSKRLSKKEKKARTILAEMGWSADVYCQWARQLDYESYNRKNSVWITGCGDVVYLDADETRCQHLHRQCERCGGLIHKDLVGIGRLDWYCRQQWLKLLRWVGFDV